MESRELKSLLIFKSKSVGLVLLFLIGLQINLQAQDEQTYVEELRGVWITNVDSDVLNSKEKIADAMDYLASRGFNIIYPVVWNKGYTLFPSEVAEDSIGFRQDPVFANANRDPLQEIITEAHRVGIEVIPWFEYGFASIFGQADGGHILTRNPHWASRDVNGNIANRNNFYWMNAIHPSVQEFMLGIMGEAIDNYDIDGVQGDDRLPAMSSTAGYSDYTKQLYRDEHDGNDPPASYDDRSFLDWKAAKLTEFAGDLYRMVKDKDTLLTLSLSPSIYSFSYDNYLQDWPTWLDSGYVDIIHPQAYRYDVGSYKGIIRTMLGQQPFSSQGYIHRFYRPQIFPGILIKAGGTFNDDDYVLEAIEFNREYDLKGEVYFFYEGLDEKNNNLADTLFKYKYNQPALLPHRNGNIRRPLPEIVNEDSAWVTTTGTWVTAEDVNGFTGNTLRAEANSGSSIIYDVNVPYDAWYNVFAWNPVKSGATTSASYEVFGQNDTVTTSLSQVQNIKKGWEKIGNVYLENGRRTVVKIDADKSGDSNPTYADAIMVMLDRKNSPNVEINAIITSAEQPVELPTGYELTQNYPNPFNPSTNISFTLPETNQVSLEVFDLIGRKVATLYQNEVLNAGQHQVTFDASRLASGMYIYRLSTKNINLSKKMILLK
jgi:uncharacterized lipoprotein YddW (UPF0748 family)